MHTGLEPPAGLFQRRSHRQRSRVLEKLEEAEDSTVGRRDREERVFSGGKGETIIVERILRSSLRETRPIVRDDRRCASYTDETGPKAQRVTFLSTSIPYFPPFRENKNEK